MGSLDSKCPGRPVQSSSIRGTSGLPGLQGGMQQGLGDGRGWSNWVPQ